VNKEQLSLFFAHQIDEYLTHTLSKLSRCEANSFFAPAAAAATFSLEEAKLWGVGRTHGKQS